MLLIFLLVLTILGVNGENCESVECDESLEPKDCPEGTFFDPFGSKDRCCAACRGGLGKIYSKVKEVP